MRMDIVMMAVVDLSVMIIVVVVVMVSVLFGLMAIVMSSGAS